MIQAESITKILCALSARMEMGLRRCIAYANHWPRDRQTAMAGKLAGDHFGLVIAADNLPNRMKRNGNEAIAFGKSLLDDRQFP